MRLDQWLAARFTYRSRSEWQTAVRRGEILLNQAPARPARILHGDEIVDFTVPDLPEPSVRTDYRVLSEFPDYLVIEKPGNLPVHPSGCFFNHTLQRLLRRDLGAEFYPVNRLDRETSGIVLFARTSGAAARLADALADHSEKQYVAYVHGLVPFQQLRAVGWLSSDPESVIRKKRRFTPKKPADPEAEKSDTEIMPIKCFDTISKVACRLHTGRLHQIRATLFSLGFPVVGDKLYGVDETIFARFSDGEMTESDKQTLIIERQALHACELKMTDPFDGKEKRFFSPVPEELMKLERGWPD